jgi:wyosine [tRNA(Phe)-imidazoG37] synthetase (radical SAM superfamily)
MQRRTRNFKYVYGPVPSRRLGFSLGIDVVPFKTCSFDCIYCQLGRTTFKTITRSGFVPVRDVVREIELALRGDLLFDYVTIAGSGEPTLYSEVGVLIEEIKRLTPKPVAVLTNSSLLWDPRVRGGVRKANLVIPSLDAGSDEVFRYINRPYLQLAFKDVTEGIVRFAGEFQGDIWLEVFLLSGVNTIRSEIDGINSIIDRSRPAKVQLNTVRRPPSESWAVPVADEVMRGFIPDFDGNVEVISDFCWEPADNRFGSDSIEIMNLLKRRPCSINDISSGLRLHRNAIIKDIDDLLAAGKIASRVIDGVIYYSIPHG